jgi:hypothetical protein
MPELIPAEPRTPALATDNQRWAIFTLFEHFGVKEVGQMRTDAARILKLDYLPDLRELTQVQADELISELRRAMSRERVSDE